MARATDRPATPAVDVVVTGGGTSGHVVPAIAILEALVEAGMPVASLRYVGSRRGVESTMVEDATGVVCEYLPISGLQRSLSPRATARNLALPARLARSTAMATRLVRRWKPGVVVSVGGYASEPMARAARAAGVPLVCVSYDRIPGLATRRQARGALVSAVAFPGSDLPRAVVTGAPVRRSIRRADPAAQRAESRVRLGVADDATMVTVVGGSLGSAALNDVVVALLPALAGRRVHVHHVAGRRYLGGARVDAADLPAGVTYERIGYDDDMASVYCATDLLVARAGASTVAEIATIGVASVLVPWSGAAEDHQRLNAEWLVEAGGAVGVEDGDTDGCVRVVLDLIDDPERRRSLAAHARDMGRLHRGDDLVATIRASVGARPARRRRRPSARRRNV